MSDGGIRTPDLSTEESGFLPANLTDLPQEVLTCIMGLVNDVVDLGFLVCTCRQFRDLARVVPFAVKGRPKHAPSSRVWTRAVLKSVRSHMPSTRVLDMAGTWVVDDDVAALLADLKNLDSLILDGCQKLTSSVADTLAVSVRSGPQTVSLQRCFGIGATAAGNLLAATAVNGSRLQCILFSHLDRLDIPRDTSLIEIEGNNTETSKVPHPDNLNLSISAGAGLRILALNNCASLGPFELVAVAATCPLLEVLMLGGSVEGFYLSRFENLSQERVIAAASALVKATEHLTNLHVLEITFFSCSVAQSVREEVRKGIEVWDFCEESSLMSAVLYLGGFKRDVLKGAQRFQDKKRKSKVCKEDMVFAVYAAANCSDMRRRTPLHVAAASGGCQSVQCLLALGAEAKGMKDSGGATALFVAAECGCANICELLLQAGADVLAGNRAGENPLYIAALRGHCAAVEVLVSYCFKNNINWQSANAYGDGWTPLMAAAVADRQDVAKILLKAIGINLSRHLNENTFSESAVCALNEKIIHIGNDESNICTSTICRIFQESHSTLGNFQNNLDWKQRVSNRNQLLDAQNRYGQTALHIAARRASVWFVCNLLIAGASTDIHDGYSMRAIDVAYHQNHEVVANIIKKWDAIQRQPLPKIKECQRSKDEQRDNDASISPPKSQSVKTKNVTSVVHKTRRNAATTVSGKLSEEHGRPVFARQSWRVKGSQKGAVPHTDSSSST